MGMLMTVGEGKSLLTLLSIICLFFCMGIFGEVSGERGGERERCNYSSCP